MDFHSVCFRIRKKDAVFITNANNKMQLGDRSPSEKCGNRWRVKRLESDDQSLIPSSAERDQVSIRDEMVDVWVIGQGGWNLAILAFNVNDDRCQSKVAVLQYPRPGRFNPRFATYCSHMREMIKAKSYTRMGLFLPLDGLPMVAGGMLFPLAEGTLQSWIHEARHEGESAEACAEACAEATLRQLWDCMPHLASTMFRIVASLHLAGWGHCDIADANFLYRSMTGPCPNLELGDLDMLVRGSGAQDFKDLPDCGTVGRVAMWFDPLDPIIKGDTPANVKDWRAVFATLFTVYTGGQEYSYEAALEAWRNGPKFKLPAALVSLLDTLFKYLTQPLNTTGGLAGLHFDQSLEAPIKALAGSAAKVGSVAQARSRCCCVEDSSATPPKTVCIMLLPRDLNWRVHCPLFCVAPNNAAMAVKVGNQLFRPCGKMKWAFQKGVKLPSKCDHSGKGCSGSRQ